MLFEWDGAKEAANRRKHGVSFTSAASVFLDPLAWTFEDPDHSFGEIRYITIGQGVDERLLVVSHVEVAEDRIRIISVRPATAQERRSYEES